MKIAEIVVNIFEMAAEVKRKVKLAELLEKKSHFLFGPRQTGKSWLIRHQLAGCMVYDLLRAREFNRLNADPSLLSDEVSREDEIVVIDAIQKIPALLDEVHWLIENRGVRFLLTGSSARKLKRGSANLLGARARVQSLHPFVSDELGEAFSLRAAFQRGLIPGIYFSDDPDLDLESYINVYLKEEIAAEGLTRNLPAFGRFLEVAAFCHAEEINFAKVSNDAQVPRSTVQEYFQILKDTLIGRELPAWKKGSKRKTVQRAKFYLFDFGVVRKLQGLKEVTPRTPTYGKALESLIFQEISAYCSYNKISDFCYWRTYQKQEVDFIIDSQIAVEVNASSHIDMRDFKGLSKLKEEGRIRNYYLVCLEEKTRVPRRAPFVTIMNWREFLSRLWSNDLSPT